MKRCSRCSENKPLSAFNVDRSSPDERRSECKDCTHKAAKDFYSHNAERVKTASRARYRRNPAAQLASNRLRKYGITPEQLDVLLRQQGGCCASCRDPLSAGRSTHVDHDHATGLIRGLLCGGCNVGLGAFKDDPHRLFRAIGYLQRFK